MIQKVSRRELSIDVAEHRSIVENLSKYPLTQF